MISSIGTTDVWRILASLTLCREGVLAVAQLGSVGVCCKAGECLEVEPQLTHLRVALADGEAAAGGAGGRVGARVARVPDVGRVGRDGGAAGGGGEYAFKLSK